MKIYYATELVYDAFEREEKRETKHKKEVQDDPRETDILKINSTQLFFK
jgi:hypothetical protein